MLHSTGWQKKKFESQEQWVREQITWELPACCKSAYGDCLLTPCDVTEAALRRMRTKRLQFVEDRPLMQQIESIGEGQLVVNMLVYFIFENSWRKDLQTGKLCMSCPQTNYKSNHANKIIQVMMQQRFICTMRTQSNMNHACGACTDSGSRSRLLVPPQPGPAPHRHRPRLQIHEHGYLFSLMPLLLLSSSSDSCSRAMNQ